MADVLVDLASVTTAVKALQAENAKLKADAAAHALTHVAAPPPSVAPATKPPSFGAGPFTVGKAITRVPGTYSGCTPIAGRRTRNGVEIVGATKDVYTIQTTDVGKSLVFEEQIQDNTTQALSWVKSAAVVGVAAPVAAVAPGALDSCINDMALKNDFVLKGYENRSDGWYIQSDNGMGARPIIDALSTASWSEFYQNPNYWGKRCTAMLPWAAIFMGTGNTASDVRAELADVRAFVKSKATGKWTCLCGPVAMGGEYYETPGSGKGGAPEQRVSISADGRSSVIRLPGAGQFWHGWGSMVDIVTDDVACTFVSVKARLVSPPAGAEYGIQVGNDYYVNSGMRYTDLGYAPSSFIARTRRLTSEWQTFTGSNLTDCGNQNPGKTGITCADFRANPPPL